MPRENEYWLESQSQSNKKVYVGGLTANTTSCEVFLPETKFKNCINKRNLIFQLRTVFKRFGNIRKIWVAQRPPGFAFIEFEQCSDAEGLYLISIN